MSLSLSKGSDMREWDFHQQQQHNQYYQRGGEEGMPAQLGCLMFIVLGLLFFSWHVHYEAAVDSAVEQVKLIVALSPLVLLLAARFLSAVDAPATPRDVPWGVAFVLVAVLFLISRRS
ncbi:uncharacterized protein LOC144701946 [Wolffia australiana]